MAGRTAVNNAGELLAKLGDLELALPACEKGLGSIIGAPSSKDLIQGVLVKALPVHQDDRSYFMEVQRIGHGLAADFPLLPRRSPRP
jgi:hypothetical protein